MKRAEPLNNYTPAFLILNFKFLIAFQAVYPTR